MGSNHYVSSTYPELCMKLSVYVHGHPLLLGVQKGVFLPRLCEEFIDIQ